MKKISCHIALILLILQGCKPDTLPVGDVISNLKISNTSPLADGTTVLDISVQLNSRADADKRNVIFRSSGGQFLPNNDTSLTQKANFENGILISRVKFKVPASVSPITISAFPETRSNQKDYMLTGTIMPAGSVPTSLTVTPSAPGVYTAYAGEVLITGTLKNGTHGVTSGAKVVFEDYDLTGKSLNGRYRLLKTSSDASSTVSTYYSPGPVAVGTSFFIRCTYLDATGQKTTITDACQLTVTQP
jgi:hypothetical protein